jgi:hypothetical protein
MSRSILLVFRLVLFGSCVFTWAGETGSADAQTDESAKRSGELLPPVKITAAGTPVEAHMGHAAPFLVDFDGDGVKDLLVGQFGEGKLAIYKNIGTNKVPKFDRKEWFQGGAPAGRVPSS